MKKHIALVLSMALCLSSVCAVQAYPADKLHSAIEGVINWKKLDNGSTADGFLINSTFLEAAGTTPGDWFPIGLGRYGYKDDYDAYLAVINEVVSKRYRESGKLSSSKATEWHRISLAVLAMGGDPTNMGPDSGGNPINLIADGTYDRGKTAPLGKQGINGWIWGLIALDSMRYPVPSGAYNSREDMIIEILRQQLPDGGFALTGNASDPDISAMALQALAPYYNDGKRYNYTNRKTRQEVSKTVGQTVDETLNTLSALQTGDGDFLSWGTQNVESTVQVLVALCSLGINPDNDSRFIKNGNTLLDGIMKYKMPDGGFVHSYSYDPENPTSLPDKANSMASEQVLYGLVAYDRFVKGMRPLYDFRPEGGGGSSAAVKETVKAEEKVEEKVEEEAVPFVFTEQDMAEFTALPKRLTTGNFVTVLKLIYRAEQSADFPEKQSVLDKLYADKQIIIDIQAEINSINREVMDKLYPFEKISLWDKQAVDAIVSRYNALSEYDRQKIFRYEDIIKAKTQVDNLLRAVIISAIVFVLIAIMAVFIILRMKKRRRQKQFDNMQMNQNSYEELRQ